MQTLIEVVVLVAETIHPLTAVSPGPITGLIITISTVLQLNQITPEEIQLGMMHRIITIISTREIRIYQVIRMSMSITVFT
jgi:hypothetical protein